MNSLQRTFLSCALTLGCVVWSVQPVWAADQNSDVDIPVIGLDGNQVLIKKIPKSILFHSLKKSSQDVHDSALEVLTRRKKREKTSWKLRTVAIGVALDAEVGLGPVVNFGFIPRLRLIFADSMTPPIP